MPSLGAATKSAGNAVERGPELRAASEGAHVLDVCRRTLGGLAPHIPACDYSHMATNLAIDDQLLEEARQIGGQKTKRATFTEALKRDS